VRYFDEGAGELACTYAKSIARAGTGKPTRGIVLCAPLFCAVLATWEGEAKTKLRHNE